MAIAITSGYDRNYQNYQRNIFSKKVFSEIQMSLDLTGASATVGLQIEYRIELASGGSDVIPWTRAGSIDASSTALKVVSIKDVPQGGWYNWNFRTVDANGAVVETVTSSNNFGVGDIFLIAGQSNGDDMFLIASSPTVNGKTSVFVAGAWAIPTTEGAATFTDHMQLALADDGEDIPVSALDICTSGSSTLAAADYVAVGHWEQNGPRPIFDFWQRQCVNALKHHQYVLNPNQNFVTECRAVVYWQGEAEASETIVLFGFVETAQYLTGLLEVYKRFQEWMPSQNDVNTIQVQIGRLQQNSVTESPDGFGTAVAMTREAHYSLCYRFPEAQAALCEMMGVNKGSDGVHHDAAQFVTASDNIAYACRKALGIAADTRLASRTRLPGNSGPTISGARWISTTTLRVTVKHEVGSDITVPSTAHECFQLVTAYGKGGFASSTRVSATEFDLVLNPSTVNIHGKVCFAYCNDAMPELGSLITDDEGYHLHPTNSEQGDRDQAVPDLVENILAGDDSICTGGTASTVTVAAGDGANIEPGDTVYVSDRIGIASRGYRRVLSVAGDVVTVSKDFTTNPVNLDVCRYSNTSNPAFSHGRHANGGIVIDAPDGGIVGIRGRRIRA